MKILIVCDAFPPEFAPRMGYLCKYLSRMGCQSDIVCEHYADDRRFAFLEGHARNVKRIRFYRSLRMPKPKTEWGILMLRDVFFRYKESRLVKEIRKDTSFSGYDLVLCSSCRTFPLGAGLALARHFDVPLVADLRDIVEQYPDKSYLSHHLPFSRLVDAWYTRRMLKERNRVLAKAAAVTSVSPWHVEFLKRFNPNTHLIYNGYDPELFFPEPKHDPYFRIVFTGRLISLRNRDPEWLFRATAELLKSGRVDKDDFRLCWYVDEESRRHILESAKEYGLEDITECSGFIPADHVPDLLNRASVLLQLANVSDENGPKGVMTTKLFESLAMGKPLLLVPGDRSYLEQILRKYDCGAAAGSVDDIERFIVEKYDEWKREGRVRQEVHPDIPRLFSRERQAEQFLRLFKNVLKDV